MRLLVSAGDPSGDIRAAELLRALSEMTAVESAGLGGDCLAAAGMRLDFHQRDYSVMGFAEVLSSAGRLLRLKSAMRRLASSFAPDAMLLVDYPGFNLPLALWTRSRGIPVIYYISPQLWAWGRGRVKKVRDGVDLMITLFRFEVEFYETHGVTCAVWAGHPLVDSVPMPGISPAPGDVLALLPGSREQEVGRLLDPMLEAFRELVDSGRAREARVAVAPGVPARYYAKAASLPGIRLMEDLGSALDGASAAAVCSGTATLETALHGVPFVIAYRTSHLTYALAKLLVSGVDRIGMANIVAGMDVAPELVQGEVTGPALAAALAPLMEDSPLRSGAVAGLSLVRQALGEPGAAVRAARIIMERFSAR
jgi:lipid-A-disaccharide synthase